MLAGLDDLRSEPDDLAVTAQGLALLYALSGDFVPGGNRLAHGDRFSFQYQAFRQDLPCNQYVVQGIEADHGRVAGPGSGNQLHGTSQGSTADFLLWRRPFRDGRICDNCREPAPTFPMR
ncbi:hypothetical protein D3C87_1490930 [compost metagenome]